MKKFLAVLVLASTLFFAAAVQAAGIQINVDSNTGLVLTPSAATIQVYARSIWVNTGIVLTPSDVLAVSNPTGTWSWGVGQNGPGGDYRPLNSFDQWIPNGMSAELIAYVGTADLNGAVQIAQGDPQLFEIGAASITRTGLSGTLWLGCNDAYFERAWSNDNSGFVTADVTVNGHAPVPEPLSLLLLGPGLAMLAGFRRRR